MKHFSLLLDVTYSSRDSAVEQFTSAKVTQYTVRLDFF